MANETCPVHALDSAADTHTSAPTPAPGEHDWEDTQGSPAHVQKRPRLDSGSQVVRSLAARPSPSKVEPLPDSPPPTPQTSTPSKITFHVRNMSSHQDEDASGTVIAPNSSPIDPDVVVGSTASAPIEIEDVEDVEDVIDQMDSFNTIEIVDERMVENFFNRFPYIHAYGETRPLAVVKNLIRHLTADDTQENLVQYLFDWLKDQDTSFADQPQQWKKLFLTKQVLWNNFSVVMLKLYSRDSINFPAGSSTNHQRQLALDLVCEHIKLVARMVTLEFREIIAQGGDKLLDHIPVFTNHLDALSTLFSHSTSHMSKLIGMDRKQKLAQLVLTGPLKLRDYTTMLSMLVARMESDTGIVDFTFVLRIMLSFVNSTIGVALFPLPLSGKPDDQYSDYVPLLDKVFQAINQKLQQHLTSNQDTFTCDFRRDLTHLMSVLLRYMVDLNTKYRDDFFAKIVGSSEVQDLAPHDYGPVAIMTWKLKLLKQYICNGRMELRVLGTDQMAHELVTFFNGHKKDTHDLRCENVMPIFQAVARVLVAEKIMDYLVSVESHPQLVTRSFHILGFLVVTNNFTQQTVDLIWNTVLTTEDPRMVSALFGALSNATKQLTSDEEDIYLCQKVVQHPLPSFGQEATQFVQSLLFKLRTTERDNAAKHRVMQLCIQLLLQFSELTEIFARRLFDDILDTLSSVATDISPDIRQSVYKHCILELQSTPIYRSAFMLAILQTLRSHPEDIGYLTSKLDLLNLSMNSFSEQVMEWKTKSDGCGAVHIREEIRRLLELVMYLFLRARPSAEDTAALRFWSHLVGADALSNDAREFAWHVLDVSINNFVSQEQFQVYDWLYESYMSKLPAQHLVRAFMPFAERVARCKLQSSSQSGQQDDSDLLMLPGLDLVWRTVLTAPKASEPERLMKFLADLFMDRGRMPFIFDRPMEMNHVLIARKCVMTMENAYSRQRGMMKSQSGIVTTAGGTLSMDEIEFSRVLQFLMTMLHCAREHPDFSKPISIVEPQSPTQSMYAPEAAVHDGTLGDEVKILLEIHSLKGPPVSGQSLAIHDLATLKELHARLATVTHFQEFRIIGGGNFISLLTDPLQTVRESGIVLKGRLIVKEDPSSTFHEVIEVPGSVVQRIKPKLELELVANFETLYKFMDCCDPISKATSDFLQTFEPHQSIIELVSSIGRDSSDVFPQGESFKQLYSLRCLSAVLEAHASQRSPHDQTFLAHGISLLENLLSATKIPEKVQDLPVYTLICKEAIPILGKFNKALGFSDSELFSDACCLVERLFEILALFQQAPDGVSTVCEIYELFLVASMQCPGFWSIFSDAAKQHDLHKELLLLHPNSILRAAISNTIKLHLQRWPSKSHVSMLDCLRYYWETLLPAVEQSISDPNNAEDVLTILNELFCLFFVRRRNSLLHDELTILQQYYNDWSQKLLHYEPQEFIGREITDKVIIGLSTLLRQCIGILDSFSAIPVEDLQVLGSELWSRYLFPSCPEDGDWEFGRPRLSLCDSQTRAQVYSLFSTVMLRRSDDFTHQVAGWILDVTEGSDDTFNSLIERSKLVRPRSGYLGLKNLGNTCYMNSLLTQFFMNPGFRDFFMNKTSPSANAPMLSATRDLFCHMQNSYDSYTNPAYFAQTVKVYGDDIDFYIQMDVEELYGALFAQWESQLGAVALTEQLHSFYGGKQVGQIKSTECEHFSETEQSFLNIQLEVLGKSNLKESLQAYIEGDSLQGANKWQCSECGGTLRNAIKRTCLKGLPDSLALHLKRFTFDVSAQRRAKINDLFEFPMEIDMAPYTFEHLSAPESVIEKDMFELVGVLVHKGEAEHGHYVSYIRTRPGSDNDTSSWLLFDDEDVSEFDPRDIPEQCFGGPFNMKGGYTTSLPAMKSNNAYMLFYERFSSLRKVLPNHEQDAMGVVKPRIPPTMEQKLHEENCHTLRRYCLFGEPHLQFLLHLSDIMREASQTEGDVDVALPRIIQCLWLSIWRIVSKVKDSVELVGILNNFQLAIGHSEQCATLIFSHLISNINGFRDIVARTLDDRVRALMQNFVVESLRLVRGKDNYGIDLTPGSNPSSSEAKGILGALLACLEKIAQTQLHYSIKGWDEFYVMLSRIADFGPEECLALIEKNFVLICLEQLVMHSSQVSLRNAHRYKQLASMLEKKGQSFNSLVCFLLTLLSHCQIQGDSADENFPTAGEDDDHGTQLPLTKQETTYIWRSNKDGITWINRIFERWEIGRETSPHGFAPARILQLLLKARGALSLRDELLFTVSDGIMQYTADVGDLFIRAAPSVLQLCEDSEEIKKIFTTVNYAFLNHNSHNPSVILQFWKDASEITIQSMPPPEEGLGSFYRHCVVAAKSYGPALLLVADQDLRDDALSFLHQIIFQYPAMSNPQAVEPGDRDAIRIKGIRGLFKTCKARAIAGVLDAQSSGQIQPLKSMWEQLIKCLMLCSEAIQEANKLSDAYPLRSADDSILQDNLETIHQAFLALTDEVFIEDDMMQSAMSVTDYTDDDDEEMLSPSFA